MKNKINVLNLFKISVILIFIIIILMIINIFSLYGNLNNNLTTPYKLTGRIDNIINKYIDLDFEQSLAYSQKEYFIDKEGLFPNELGEIMIIMYHGVYNYIIDEEDIYHKSIDGFKRDIQKLYDYNYYFISMDDYLNGIIDVPYGYTPAILTFDDGLSSSFSLDENYLPKENTAVQILEKFEEENENFNATATFFINSYIEQFAGYGNEEDAINYLIDKGYSIGNHTYSHKSFEHLNNEQLQEEIGIVHNKIKYNNNYDIVSLAYPYGEIPNDIEYVLNGSYMEKEYNYKIGLIAGSGSNTTNIFNIDFNRYNVPRIRGTNNAVYDLGWYLEYYQENPHLKFISDGEKDVITIPVELYDKVNFNMLVDKELVILNYEE